MCFVKCFAKRHPACKVPLYVMGAVLLATVAKLAWVYRPAPSDGGTSPFPVVTDAKPAEPDSSPEILARGKQLFGRHCAGCHGNDGKGKGDAAYLLFPKPRDLTSRSFRLTSNADGVVAVPDVFRAITHGMPGSAMPSWEIIAELDRWGLAHYVKSLGRPDRTKPTPIEVPPEPPMTAESIATGRHLFTENCAACHGASGRGDGTQEMFDSDGFPTRPRDLTMGIFKGGREGNQIFVRIKLGMPGSPMPEASSNLGATEIWNLVHYVQSLSSPGADLGSQQRLKTITAKRLPGVKLENPVSEEWKAIPSSYLALMPLWWRDAKPPGVMVRAAHDNVNLFIQVEWEDTTHNDAQLESHTFRDGIAIQLTADPEPPFLGMGHKDADDVRVWHWKADRDKDLTGRQDVQHAHPSMYVTTNSPRQRQGRADAEMGVDFGGVRDARATEPHELDRTFITALGAGNVVATMEKTNMESLTARGMGSLGARPTADKGVTASALWKNGIYAVVFKRALKQDAEGGLSLGPGAKYCIAFAVWNGATGDRDGQKSVTIWHRLQLGD